MFFVLVFSTCRRFLNGFKICKTKDMLFQTIKNYQNVVFLINIVLFVSSELLRVSEEQKSYHTVR